VIRIDGAEQSGSGTIVRFAVAFAALRGEALHVVNARARRAKPGLRPQHLAAVRAAAALCGGRTEGLAVGAREFVLRPGGPVRAGAYAFDIGTAGSATMLALGILPLACLADGPVAVEITGGVFQDFAPSPHHMQHVLAPLLGRMGAAVELRLLRAGYVPRGAGRVELRVRPAAAGLRALALDEPGSVRALDGVAFASHLAERRVAERMAAACAARCAERGLPAPRIERVEDVQALHPGASLAVWATTSTDARLGADRAGAFRRSSEAIGRFVADALADDLASGATTDRHLADQLVPFAALASGATRFRAPRPTEHLATNLWLAERFGARAARDGARVEVTGLGLPAGAARAAVG
jgi:RNA 3'-terminal phosphate cyclase (ATP)